MIRQLFVFQPTAHPIAPQHGLIKNHIYLPKLYIYFIFDFEKFNYKPIKEL